MNLQRVSAGKLRKCSDYLFYTSRRAGRQRPAAPGAEQKEGLVQSQEAFRFLQNYSAEQAYGLTRQSEVET